VWSIVAAETTCGQWALLRQHVVIGRRCDNMWSMGAAETTCGQLSLLRQHVVNGHC
jgi:hypothetical protein